MKRILISALFVGLLLGCATTNELEQLREARPTPELAPREVVELQLQAFRANDEEDRGIEVAFRFASPRNKRVTGPAERFARMMKGPLYRAMLVYDEAEYGETLVRGRVALQRVQLTVGERRVSYEFYLIRQEGGPFDQCWMTESVSIVPTQEPSATLNV
jgi:hypothetical protein